MALRVFLGWIGVNIAALVLLAFVDIIRVGGRGIARLIGRPQPAQQPR
jgi:hypothetical protein